MMFSGRPLIAVAICAVMPLVAAADTPLRDRFAYSIPLDVPSGEPVVRLDMPFAVYRDCVDATLRDMRVLNGAGELVPFTMRRGDPGILRQVAPTSLPLFPLRGPAVESPSSLRFRLESGGAVFEVAGADAGGKADDAPVTAYLVNAESVDAPIASFSWEWPEETADFTLALVVSASDDLEDWRTVASNAPLARLRHGGEKFEQHKISFTPTRARYWRMSAAGAAILPPFTSVSATTVIGAIPAERMHIEVAGKVTPGLAGDYEFDLGAQIPVDRVELLLPDINTVAEVDFWTRRDSKDPWQRIEMARVYRLQGAGGEMTSPALEFMPDSRRYWRVKVDPRGGGIGTGVPRLRAGWLNDQLIFVTRGGGPFEIVYGSYDATPAMVELDSILGAVRSMPAGIPFASAGESRNAGGPDILRAPSPPGPWRTWILWIALVTGVVTLGVVALNLARQMRATS
jgi:hypothetical protein